MLRRPPASAFTLIELLTVITIIGILAGIVIGVGRRAGESGREARAKVELATISTALESYKRQQGDYPRVTTPAALLQSIHHTLDLVYFTMDREGDPSTDTSLQLVYPWDKPYSYYHFPKSANRSSTYLIYSLGADGLDVAPTSIASQNRNEPANLDNIYAND